jgi:hypothetical protein
VNNNSTLSEKTIENLLRTLSAEKKPYPRSLLDGRRAIYMSQVLSVVSGGPHLTKGGGHGQGGSHAASAPMTPLMKVVLIVLIAGNIAMAAYLGVSVYENWDKVQAWLSGGASVSETSPAPLGVSTEAPAITTEIVVSPEGTIVPASTPEPNNLSGSDSSTNPEVSTPDPNKPGLHLGQTPHGPDQPPSSNNQDNSQNNNQGNQDKNKEKKK